MNYGGAEKHSLVRSVCLRMMILFYSDLRGKSVFLRGIKSESAEAVRSFRFCCEKSCLVFSGMAIRNERLGPEDKSGKRRLNLNRS